MYFCIYLVSSYLGNTISAFLESKKEYHLIKSEISASFRYLSRHVSFSLCTWRFLGMNTSKWHTNDQPSLWLDHFWQYMLLMQFQDFSLSGDVQSQTFHVLIDPLSHNAVLLLAWHRFSFGFLPYSTSCSHFMSLRGSLVSKKSLKGHCTKRQGS